MIRNFFGPGESQYPTKDRSCTDLLCAIIFIAFLCCSIAASVYGFATGDISNIAQPFDSDGLACGRGEAKNFPYLYFNKPLSTDYVKETVCVKACPREDTETVDCKANTDVTK